MSENTLPCVFLFKFQTTIGKPLEICLAEQFSKTQISIHFNLLQFLPCPASIKIVFDVLFKPSFNVLSNYFYVSPDLVASSQSLFLANYKIRNISPLKLSKVRAL